jgi:hypothetical protein
MKRVSGILEINWTVELPDEKQRESNMCEDPAKEAVIEFIPQSGGVFIWGDDGPAAEVYLESYEEDIVIEEDERD